MTIEVPDAELRSLNLSSQEARLDLAVGCYTAKRVSMGQAAKVAGISYSEFLHELGRRGISVNYSTEEFRHDLSVLRDAKREARDDRHQ